MKIAPISIYDVASQQAWLEDLAARGEFLSSHGGTFARFYKDAPKTVRYRFEPLGKKEALPDRERQEIYRELGWQYVCTVSDVFHIWRCDDPDAPELDTDPQVQGGAYEYLYRRVKWLNLVCLAILLVPLLLFVGMRMALGPSYGDGLLRSWLPLWRVLILQLMLLVAFWQGITTALSLRRFIRSLQTGISQPQRKPYRVGRAMHMAAATIYLLWLISCFTALFQPRSRPFEPVNSFEEAVPYVEIQGAEEVRAIRWKNWRTSKQWWIIQGDWDGVYAQSEYYEFRTELSAKWAAMDKVKVHGLMPVEEPALDGVWQSEKESVKVQNLVIWDDRRVIDVAYTGPEEVAAYLDDYAALLGGNQ